MSLSLKERSIKRGFDLVLSTLLLLCIWPIILSAYIIAAMETKSNGFFIQRRVGKNGKIFDVIKIKTMFQNDTIDTTITTSTDTRISRSGKVFRKTKIDELPQLINVLLGEMSFVGPRPDVPGYADLLKGEERSILSTPPGITGPATLKYRDEEEILSQQSDPIHYNNTVIWPDKVQINMLYIQQWSLLQDIKYILKTLKG